MLIIVFRPQIKVVDKQALAAGQMARDMGQLVQQAKPEIVETVIAQRHADNGRPIIEQHRGTVEVSVGKVRGDHQHDAVLSQKYLRPLWTVLECAQLGDLAQERAGDDTLAIGFLRFRRQM